MRTSSDSKSITNIYTAIITHMMMITVTVIHRMTAPVTYTILCIAILLLSMTVTVMLTHMQILTMHTIMHITIPPAVIITPVFLRSSISSLISKFLKRYREMYWRCTV